MPPRSLWKGVITFGMVSIPVRLFSATQDKDVSFHLLHQPDHSRIKFKRFCATEDVEVSPEDLVRAFEVGPDQYVEITDEDLEKLPLPARHSIELSSFVKSDEIDPIYYDTSYYLEPEEIGMKPYALLQKALENKGVLGMATVAIRNKESLCALRVEADGLVLATLHYPDEIRERPAERPQVLVNERELEVAGSLVEALEEPFEPSRYHDRYREALLELIASKAAGHEAVVPESEPAAAPSDLMAALRASLEAARDRKNGPRPGAGSASAPASAAAARHRESADKADKADKADEANEADEARPARKPAVGKASSAAGDGDAAAATKRKPARRRKAAA